MAYPYPPGAIIFVNDDLAETTQTHLVRLLLITDVQDGYEFDGHVAADPEYPTIVRRTNQRIMVVRTFIDRGTLPTWTIPDIVMFVKNGMASIEKNNFGPPGFTMPVLHLYWGALGVFA